MQIIFLHDTNMPNLEKLIANLQSPVGIEQYGLASSDGTSWKWSGVCRVSSFREIADFMDVAAHLGIKTHQMFAGTVITAKKNLEGEVEYDQQYAIQIDLEYF